MAGVSDAVLEEIKARTDLAELVSSYGIAVRHTGSSAKACCPFHHEKTPSFNINTSRGFYHCFGCGESGDAIKFVQKMDGLTFVEAVRKLAEPLGIQVKVGGEGEGKDAQKRKRLLALMAELAAFYHRCLLKMKEAEPARAYLKERDLDEKTCEDWIIGYAPNGTKPILTWGEKYGYSLEDLVDAGVLKAPSGPGDSGYHRFSGRLMFSIRDKQGRVVAFSGRQIVEKKNSGKYVNSPETLIFKKSNVLFGFDKAAANIAKSPHREAIACEGQIDTIRLHLNGFPVAVASQGTAFTEEHARMLKRVCDAMILAYDDDAAGHKATVKVGGMMLALEVPVRVARIPDGDDPDSFLRKNGAAAFQKLIDGAESIVAFQVRSERAKERDVTSIDAVSRVSRAVLSTIAKCPSAILKASMVDEAAKLLGLPLAAVNEEMKRLGSLENLETLGNLGRIESLGGEEDLQPDPGSDAGEIAPPPDREIEMMSFLLPNDRDTTLDGMVGEFLPPWVFAHDFTRRFVEAWRLSVATGEDRIADFAKGLGAHECAWLERMQMEGFKADAGERSPAEIFEHEYVIRLWQAYLKREQGKLPAQGGDAALDARRIEISRAIKQLNMIKWHAAKDLIRQFIREHDSKGEKWT